MRKQTKHNMKLDKRKIHATWTKKKKPSYELILFLCLVMVYADLKIMEVSVLCRLTQTTQVQTELLILGSAFFYRCYFGLVSTGKNWCQLWHLTGITAGWLHQKQVQSYRSTKRSQSFKVEIYLSRPKSRIKQWESQKQSYTSIPTTAEGYDSITSFAIVYRQNP